MYPVVSKRNTDPSERRRYSTKQHSQSLVCTFLLLICLIVLTACHANVNDAWPDTNLVISATVDRAAGTKTIPFENSETAISVHQLTNVTVSVDRRSFDLEEGITDGALSVYKLFSLAREDAANGFCAESWESRNGLSQFTYRYPTIQLTFIHDVYETPDGKQHLISTLDISEPGGLDTMHRAYYDEATHLPLDREDWGLTFEEPQATATGLTLPYSHTGGQQIGKLQTESYQIFSEETKEPVQPLNSDDTGSLLDPGQFLALNAGGEIVIDWTQSHGNLPSGTYILRLTVQDVYDESQCHPLMRNFHDTQTYEIIFKIN